MQYYDNDMVCKKLCLNDFSKDTCNSILGEEVNMIFALSSALNGTDQLMLAGKAQSTVLLQQ